jgi:hypothetical protein
MRPESDFVFTNLRAVALKGGEYGPLYDQGILFVIRQIEETGSFVPNIATILIDMHSNPQIAQACFTREERAEAMEIVRQNGWTLEQGSQYGKGVQAARMLLKAYEQKARGG